MAGGDRGDVFVWARAGRRRLQDEAAKPGAHAVTGLALATDPDLARLDAVTRAAEDQFRDATKREQAAALLASTEAAMAELAARRHFAQRPQRPVGPAARR